MDYGDTLIVAFVIVLFAVMLTVFPLLLTANYMDSASQATLQTQMTNFVNEICDTGKITKEAYDKFEEHINGPNSYNIEIEVKVLDENPSKQITQGDPTKAGENVYVSYYTSQIIDQLDDKTRSGVVLLKEGDQIHISIANTNKTFAQQLASIVNVDISTIIAETTQVCTMNGI